MLCPEIASLSKGNLSPFILKEEGVILEQNIKTKKPRNSIFNGCFLGFKQVKT